MKSINLLGGIADYPILLLREVSLMTSLSHPNVIEFKEAYVWDTQVHIMMERFKGETLFSYMTTKGSKISEQETAQIIQQILMALKYLHQKKWIHRDIKPENIMIKKDALTGKLTVKLIDFGTCN